MLRGYNGTGSVKQDNGVALFAEGDFQHTRSIFQDAQHANDWRRIDRLAERLVVKADVAAGNRRAQFVARNGQAINRFAELPHYFRLFRAAKVQAVRRRNRARAACSDIASRSAAPSLAAT